MQGALINLAQETWRETGRPRLASNRCAVPLRIVGRGSRLEIRERRYARGGGGGGRAGAPPTTDTSRRTVAPSGTYCRSRGDAEVFLMIHTHTARDARKGTHQGPMRTLTRLTQTETDYLMSIPPAVGPCPWRRRARRSRNRQPPFGRLQRPLVGRPPVARGLARVTSTATSDEARAARPSSCPRARHLCAPPTAEPLMAVPAGSRNM